MNTVRNNIIALCICLIFSTLAKANDTIPCLILYTDTAIVQLFGTDEEGEDYEIWDVDPNTYQMKALYVPGENLWMDTSGQPLSPTIVIWQVKYLQPKPKQK